MLFEKIFLHIRNYTKINNRRESLTTLKHKIIQVNISVNGSRRHLNTAFMVIKISRYYCLFVGCATYELAYFTRLISWQLKQILHLPKTLTLKVAFVQSRKW